MRAWLDKYQHRIITTALLGGLSVCFFYVCLINLSMTPSFYCTDMYSDILYAVRAWESKSLFPDGWVFGNQFYVIGTPVLSALIYGIIGHAARSMAIASVCMTIGIALSLLWMLKPVFSRLEEQLIVLLGLVVITAYYGDAVYSINGWQLFFTMCSYYACYLITSFLCFGFFLRRGEELTKSRIALLVLTFFLSFGAGIQSLRQTVIMVPSMLVLEAIAQLKAFTKHKKIQLQPLLMTTSLSAANLLGVFVIRLLNVPQREIFNAVYFLERDEIALSVSNTLKNMTELFLDREYFGMLLLVVIAFVVLNYFQSKWNKQELPTHWNTLVLLFAFSVMGVALIDIFTQMTIRSIYYFMLFPLVAIFGAYAYRQWKGGKVIVLVLLTMLVIGSFQSTVLPASKTAKASKNNISYEVSEMLIEKGYTTIYSGWNQCEDIAIASGGKITAGFWNRSKDVFSPVMYLCDPSIYETESEKCVYYLRRDNLEIALQEASERGATMTLIAAYPEWGFWLYESSQNLMTPQDN